jgi:hypothetical protein
MTMRAGRWLVAVVAVIAIAAASRADEPGSGASEKEIKRLIEQLGSERFRDREEASGGLARLGKSALPGLKEATKSPDAEVRRRARRLVEKMERPAGRSMTPEQERQNPAVKFYL